MKEDLYPQIRYDCFHLEIVVCKFCLTDPFRTLKSHASHFDFKMLLSMFSLLGQSFVNVAQVVNEPTLIIWSMSHMVIWWMSHMVNVTRRVRLSHPKSERFLVRTAELSNRNLYVITKWGKFVLRIGAALFYYKLGQKMLQIGTALLLQIWPVLLHIEIAITNQGNCYYKIGQLLQIGAEIITN